MPSNNPSSTDLVVKSNALIEAAHSLTVAESKLILAAIAQVRRDEVVTDDVRYTVTANALADMGGFKANHEYRALKQASKKLWEQAIRITEYPNGKGSRPRVLLTRWVQSILYREDEGAVEVRFSKDIIPYLSQLTAEFSQYRLQNVSGMTSSYGVRLYELLIQWRGRGEREVEIDWLRYILNLEDKYPSIRDLKRRVIEPAVNDVNDHSDLSVTWGQRKTGRRVTHIQFKFGSKKDQKPPRLLEAKDEESLFGYPKHLLDHTARPGESYEQVANRLREKHARNKEIKK
ncbi:RepB family plasmid replication initiator protein [Halomonas salipaludis]|uniref:RepB family plasmid replication initiator protein n=1 Tax=Halomonas salipaludis TaxID=2032625 RepID=A0A2A2ENJ7_9GAMM|nr:RepB family plasmid replication initiator protein [Halomonas salipaludis]PAU74064.1 RepB family plasmid replication initiator protein [Halomonas salipaludis]